MNDLNKAEIDELENLLFSLINAYTKAVGKEIRKKLDFKASGYHDRLEPYLRGKLKEAINYADEASGQDRQKQHWEEQFRQSWYVFKSNMNRSKSKE